MSTFLTILVTAILVFPLGYYLARKKYLGKPLKLQNLPLRRLHLKQILGSGGQYYLAQGEWLMNPMPPSILEGVEGYSEEGWYQIGMKEGRIQVKSEAVKS